MSDELQIPPVVDLGALLQPISDEFPSGESLRYSGLYDEIAEARRADDTLDKGQWQAEQKVADFRRVIELAEPALTSRTKDLQVAAWLCEALIKQHGFAGLRDGLQLISGLHENFWDTLHPEIDEGDMEGRANAVAWIDALGALAVKGVPITAGEGLSYIGWEDSKRFDIPENLDSLDSGEQERFAELKVQAERENRVTGNRWRKAVAATRRAFCETTNYALDECFAALDQLNRAVDEKYDRNQAPSLGQLKKSLEDVQIQVKRLLEEKRREEPSESDAADEMETSADGNGGYIDGEAFTASASGPVRSRKEALKRLGEVAAFFQRTEPHSPVSYLVQRAVKWGNMPLDSWLQDVIKDESVLFQLRETLGLNTQGESSTGYSDTSSDYSESSDYQ